MYLPEAGSVGRKLSGGLFLRTSRDVVWRTQYLAIDSVADDVQNGRQAGAVDWSISLKAAAAPSDVQQQQTASCNARFTTVTFLGCLPSRRSHYELHCSWHITEVTTRRGLSPLLDSIVRWRRLIHFSLMTRLYLARCDGRSTCRSGDFLTATDTSFSSRVK